MLSGNMIQKLGALFQVTSGEVVGDVRESPRAGSFHHNHWDAANAELTRELCKVQAVVHQQHQNRIPNREATLAFSFLAQ